MDKKSKKNDFEARNSESFRRHRRQRFWQIWVPLILITLVILAAAVLIVLTLTGTKTGISLSQYGDTSLIWILIPLFVIALVITAVLGVLIILNGKMLKNLPRFAHPVQKVFSKVSGKTESVTGKMVQPIISIRSIASGVGKAFSLLSGWFKK